MKPFDTGYCVEPFKSLCEDYPAENVYPPADFRTEWGPIFHRGRLDGSARVLLLGQDPATHETAIRRILVGTAGKRTQGFLARLGILRSYVMVNTFLYSVFGQQAAQRHSRDEKIAAYRHRWIDAIFATSQIEAVIALGSLADKAWKLWQKSPNARDVPYVHITHPTAAEGTAAGNAAKMATLTKALLQNWNQGLASLDGHITPDKHVALKSYGDAWAAGDLVDIVPDDVPAGTPDWMRLTDGWAVRGAAPTRVAGKAALSATLQHRATLLITAQLSPAVIGKK